MCSSRHILRTSRNMQKTMYQILIRLCSTKQAYTSSSKKIDTWQIVYYETTCFYLHNTSQNYSFGIACPLACTNVLLISRKNLYCASSRKKLWIKCTDCLFSESRKTATSRTLRDPNFAARSKILHVLSTSKLLVPFFVLASLESKIIKHGMTA